MKFSYSAVWDDAVRLMRSHASLLLAIAGVFIFLPSLILNYAIPQPDVEADRMMAAMEEYFTANWHWVLLTNLVNMVGAIAIYRMIFARGATTVGGAISAGLMLLPFYFLASVASGILIVLGTIALIIPGLYLLGRLATIGPIVVAEERRNPVDAIKRSFAITKGRGWAILGLVLLIVVAGTLVTWAITAVLGSIFLLVGGEGVGRLLVLILDGALSTVFVVVLIVVLAALYRALTAEAASVPRTADQG